MLRHAVANATGSLLGKFLCFSSMVQKDTRILWYRQQFVDLIRRAPISQTSASVSVTGSNFFFRKLHALTTFVLVWFKCKPHTLKSVTHVPLHPYPLSTVNNNVRCCSHIICFYYIIFAPTATFCVIDQRGFNATEYYTNWTRLHNFVSRNTSNRSSRLPIR